MGIRSVELFAGGGGLLLGAAEAGAEHVAAAEWNHWACETMRRNSSSRYPRLENLNVLEGDVRDIDWNAVPGASEVDLVTGGPPCQPFSLGGAARNANDPRDMFPATTAVIEKLRPRAFIIENVKGLTRSTFAEYFEYVQLRLQHPTMRAAEGKTWVEHYSDLKREHAHAHDDLSYRLTTTLVDAANYGVPQRRHRVFMVGFRSDVEARWSFPRASHSASALLRDQNSGAYWERHRVATEDRIPIRTSLKNEDGLLPWMTVRDAIAGMPAPGVAASAPGWLDHKFQPGAKIYPGHTGSPIDEPSKALKAGVHGVPGGENMMRFPDGSVRYFTVREAARIQTFPDDYALHGAWSEVMRQLGNAVPVRLAKTVAQSVTAALSSQNAQTSDEARKEP